MNRLLVLLAVLLCASQTALATYPPPAITTAPLTVFVSPTGADGNKCEFSTSPCKTIQGAINQVPQEIQHPVTVQLAAGTYTEGAYIDGFTVKPFKVLSPNTGIPSGAFLRIKGTMTVATLSGTMDGTATSATAGSGATWGTLVKTGAGWTVNALRGYLLEIYSGTGADQVATIASNTADTITIAGTWFPAPAAGSQFKILDWASTISVPETGLKKLPPMLSGTTASGTVPVSGITSGSMLLFGNNMPTGFQVQSGAVVAVQRVKFLLGAGSTSAKAVTTLGPSLAVFSCLFDGNVIGVSGTADYSPKWISIRNSVKRNGGTISSAANLLDCQGTNKGASADVQNNVLTGGSLAISSTTGVVLVYSNSMTSGYRGLTVPYITTAAMYWNKLSGLTDSAVVAGTTSFLSRTVGLDLNANAFTSNGAAAAVIRGRVTLAIIGNTGTGNTGYGLVLTDGAYARVDSANTLTGTIADVQMDGVDYSYATMRAASPKSLTSAVTGSRIYE